MSYIQIDNVEKRYGDFVALRGFSLEIEEGEFVSLLGPSGCGKTSLLRSIAGLEDIQGGSITVNGTVMSRAGYTMPPERRNLGLIFQSYALWPHMTVFKNIAYALKQRRWDRKDIARRVAEVLRVVGLEGFESRLPSQLSGGQMQRVAVARSLAPQPAVLLFDEPLSNLDAKLRESMRFELRRIQREVGITAVYVTHDQAEAMVISDRIILMNQGRIVQEGTARELYETPETAFAARFLGFSNMLQARVRYGAGPDGLGQCELSTIGGTVVPARLRTGMGPGTVVDLSIRPESLRIEPREGDGSTSVEGRAVRLPGTITDLVYAGNVCDVFVTVGEQSLRAQVTPVEFSKLAVGGTVTVEFDAYTAWAVPAESGDAVGADADAFGGAASRVSSTASLTKVVV